MRKKEKKEANSIQSTQQQGKNRIAILQSHLSSAAKDEK
jgi:hypothetical protein